MSRLHKPSDDYIQGFLAGYEVGCKGALKEAAAIVLGSAPNNPRYAGLTFQSGLRLIVEDIEGLWLEPAAEEKEPK